VNDIMGGMFGAIVPWPRCTSARRPGAGRTCRWIFENNVLLVAQHMMQASVTGTPAAPMPSRIAAWQSTMSHRPRRRADLPGGRLGHAVGDLLRAFDLADLKADARLVTTTTACARATG